MFWQLTFNAAANRGNTINKGLKYITFDTDNGWLGILSSAKGLLRTTLPHRSAKEAEQLLGDRVSQAIRSADFFNDLIQRLRVYFGGHRVVFPDELDLSQAAAFQREVWRITGLIPYGETRSYTWVAEQLGKAGAARAVGRALSGNPLPIIIPCHRVVAYDGKLGGFSGGLEMKRYLLHLEASASSR